VDPSAPNSWAVNPCYGWPYGSAPTLAGRMNWVVRPLSIPPGHVSTGRRYSAFTSTTSSHPLRQPKAVCDSMIVVESAVWTGDSYTDPKPFTVADAIAAAGAVSPNPLELLDRKQPGDDGTRFCRGHSAHLRRHREQRHDREGRYLMPLPKP